jgi:magnesium transporter
MATEMLNNTSSTYLAMISIEMASTDHKMNESMKFFGAIATVILPLTVITGLWGMNVRVPGQSDESDSTAWFFGICVALTLWVIFVGIYFKNKSFF